MKDQPDSKVMKLFPQMFTGEDFAVVLTVGLFPCISQ